MSPNQQALTQTVGVIGAGVVGGALIAWLRRAGHDVRVYDPAKGYDVPRALDDAPIVFVCVPTPYAEGVGFDASALFDAVAGIPGARTIVIKSTVLPGTTDALQQQYPQHRFLFNPEFLREISAVRDFAAPDRQIVGFTRESEHLAHSVLAMLPRAPFELLCPAAEAEMAKYAANAFLAIKVTFANEIYDLCARLQLDYAQVRDIAGADPRIGLSHLDVLTGGYRGYGGACLPKDTRALLDLAARSGIDLQLVAAAHRVNARLRSAARTRPQRTGSNSAQDVSAREDASRAA